MLLSLPHLTAKLFDLRGAAACPAAGTAGSCEAAAAAIPLGGCGCCCCCCLERNDDRSRGASVTTPLSRTPPATEAAVEEAARPSACLLAPMAATDLCAKLMLRCFARVVRCAAVAVTRPLRMCDTAWQHDKDKDNNRQHDDNRAHKQQHVHTWVVIKRLPLVVQLFQASWVQGFERSSARQMAQPHSSAEAGPALLHAVNVTHPPPHPPPPHPHPHPHPPPLPLSPFSPCRPSYCPSSPNS